MSGERVPFTTIFCDQHDWLYAVPYGDMRVCCTCTTLECLDEEAQEERWVKGGIWDGDDDPLGVIGWVAG